MAGREADEARREAAPSSAARGFWGLVERLRANRLALGGVLVANLLGIAYGYYYYVEVGQFDPASEYFRAYGWWPFIPDSPNAVLLASAALVLGMWGRRSRLLDAVAFTAMVYVGVWTTALFLLFPDQLGTFDWQGFPESANPLLFVTHMGMPLEALLLVPAMRRDPCPWPLAAGVVAWIALGLWLDYGPVHLHPAPFLRAHAPLHAVSPWIAVGTVGLWVALERLGRGRGRPAGRAHRNRGPPSADG